MAGGSAGLRVRLRHAVSPTMVLGLLGLVAVGAYSALLLHLSLTTHYDMWGAAVFGPLILLVSVPLLKRLCRDEPAWFFWFLLAALSLKLVGALARYFLTIEVYGGLSDASVYARYGERLAAFYRQGDFSVDTGRKIPGTGGLRMITGLLFSVTGRTLLGGFLIFAWWSFWGQLAFYKAFRTALPEGDHRRYALLVFLTPSLLYWPSSIGKDAWMLLGLGLAALGAARLLARRRQALPYLAAGLAATTLIRPHISVLICAGLLAAFVLRPRSDRPPLLGPLSKPLGIGALLMLSVLMVAQTGEFFDTDEDGVSAVTQVLDSTSEQTNQGGSEFEPVNARSVAEVPAAVLAVMVRPFPWEARSGQMLLSSFEGVVLLVLIAASWRRFRGLRRLMRRRPYLVFAAVYALLFCVAFSSVGNFGILTRQRVQLFPFALVLLALPRLEGPVRAAVASGTGRRPAKLPAPAS